MSRTISLALGSAVLLMVTACSGTAAPTAAPASVEPASQPPAASESAAAGEAPCAPSADAGTVTASMANIAFDPAAITAKVGDVIAWTNNDSTAHTATVTSDPTCTTPSLDSGATGAIVFNVAGSYEFFCKIHSNMTGTIEVS
jgi:plastocyanin